MQVLYQLFKVIVSSDAETELAALFITGKKCVPLRQDLIELHHPQPPTPLITENKTTENLANATIKQKHSKSIDMRFYWVKVRVKQQQHEVTSKPDKENLADYFT